MKVSRRFTPVGGGREVRLEGEGAAAKIRGYGAVFYDGTPATEYRFYDVIERILPGAFNYALPRSDVRGLFNHDPNQILGREKAGTMALSIDAVGLAYSIDPPQSPVGETVTEALRRRDVTGSSFAFTVTDKGQRWSRDDDGLYIREIVSADELFDVGPVVYPAYDGAESSLRSLGEPEDFAAFKAAADAGGNGEALREAHKRAAQLRAMRLTEFAR